MWFRRSIAAAAGTAILAGLIAAIVEQKKVFDEKEKAAKAEEDEDTEMIELTPEEPSGDSEE
ncbi:MAG: hypothetical protein IKS37_08545 [Solobacterium sp.]|nr:hypothetical protein [Solobacterium sp.]